MKKLLLLITGLLLLFSVEGQILRYSNYTAPAPAEVLVESISVWGTGGATTISTNGGTLQMLKKTLPTNAADTTATWSATNGTGTANISAGGVLTALTNGTVTARATANDGSDVYGEEEITISNQVESLISNGTFSSSDDWNPFADWTISGGAANMAAGTSASLLTQLADDMITSLTESTDYTLAFDIVSSAPGVYFSFVSYDGAIQSTLISGANYTTNSYSINFSTPVGVTGHGIAFLAYGDAAATLDNVVLTIR